VLVCGTLAGVPVVAMRGRVHFYEGYSLGQVTFPVRVMRRLGAATLIATNAAGGLNPAYRAGDLMVLADHLNLMGLAGHNALIGSGEPELGARFLDMLAAYAPDLREVAHAVARQAGFALREGVYVMVGGPSYETAAEVRFLQHAGADAVGMSTIPEVIVARQEQMRVLGISVITNQAVGAAEVSHEAVLAAADAAKPRLEALVRGVLRRLADGG
jgi:purine-nucleoside phosphorylase